MKSGTPHNHPIKSECLFQIPIQNIILGLALDGKIFIHSRMRNITIITLVLIPVGLIASLPFGMSINPAMNNPPLTPPLATAEAERI